MKRDGRRERFCVWVVTDGEKTKYLALCESQATAFARSYNGFVAEDAVRVWVEEKTAYFLPGDRNQQSNECGSSAPI